MSAISSIDFQLANQASIDAARRKMNSSYTNKTRSNSASSVFEVSEQGNYCTDGKDDGKIGVFGVIGNILEGAAKGALNMLKGAVTDNEGNFSLGKTLTSIGTVALCVACPAVGFALAGVGVVTGGAKLVSGVVNALNSDTDAEAKDNWEQVGEGAFTIGVSIWGAKSSAKAIQNSSSAGALSTFKQTSSFAKNPSGYVKALGKDMISSTKNNFTKLKTNLRTLSQARELNSARKAVANQKGAPTQQELTQRTKLDFLEELSSPEVKAAAESMSRFGTNVRNALRPSNIKTNISSLLKGKGGQGLIKTLRTNVKANGGLVKTVLNNLSAKQKAIYAALTKEGASYNTLVQQYGYENVIGVLQILGEYSLLDDSI